jgi:hypothetical protein
VIRYLIERYYPFVCALLMAIMYMICRDKIAGIDEIIKKLLDTSLSISGTLLGFLLTILTIISTIQTRRMRFLKESGHYYLVNNYLRAALFSNIISISIYFLLPIVLSFTQLATYKNWIYAAVIFAVFYGWLANIRFSSIFIKLLVDPADLKKPQKKKLSN